MSIHWSDTPPPTSKLNHLPLQRVKSGQGIKGAITSTQLVGMDVHYVNGRTLPHVDTDCPGCAAKRRKSWEGYISIWTLRPSRHIIAVLTPPAANDLLDLAPERTNLRALAITLERVSKRDNSRLVCKVWEHQDPTLSLPAPPDLRSHLWHIWGLDQAILTEDHPLYAAMVRNQCNAEANHGIRPRTEYAHSRNEGTG